MATQRLPGDDEAVAKGAELTVLKAVREYKREAEDAKKTRMKLNALNVAAYLGEQDWTQKQAGQSREFLPKTPIAVEQWSAFMKRALIQFGQWKSVDTAPDYPLPGQDVLDLLDVYLDRIPDGAHKFTSIALILSEAIKVGLLEALIILKIYGRTITEREFFTKQGVKYVQQNLGGQDITTPVVRHMLKRRERPVWRLCIDIVKPADYFPDPTGRNLYEIHAVERDLHDVQDLADQGIYDPAVVEDLEQDFAKAEDDAKKARRANQDYSATPDFRKRVKIDEFWGSLLDEEGQLAERNIVCAVANDRYLLRPPEPNPNWHGESPFVTAPLVRVPGSVWHKAIYDHGTPLNFAENELFNLMLDGGISSVWGVKQLRQGWLEDARQVAGGIPQGITLGVKDEMPPDMKVLERVDTGSVPPESMAMFQIVDRQFDGAVYTNDLKLGLFPPKHVLATEVVEASQSQAVTLDGISADLEHGLIAPALRKAWMTILQNADDLSTQDVVRAIGLRSALMLSRLSPPERFAKLAQGAAFTVHGLSATLGRVRDFQKLMALMQAVMGNPMLLQTFMKKFSPDKTLMNMMKMLNVNPENLQMSEDEQASLQQRIQELPMWQQFTGNRPAGGNAAPVGTEMSLPAEINQAGNPLTGMSVGGK